MKSKDILNLIFIYRTMFIYFDCSCPYIMLLKYISGLMTHFYFMELISLMVAWGTIVIISLALSHQILSSWTILIQICLKTVTGKQLPRNNAKQADDKIYVCKISQNVSSKLYHSQNSKTSVQTVQIQGRRLIMSRLIWNYAVCKFNYFLCLIKFMKTY